MIAYLPCPKCQNNAAERLKFTWWGGMLGPRLLTHVKCAACGNKYNGKTGGDNFVNIVIYSIIVGAVVLALTVVLVAALIIFLAAGSR